jgi:hypothetical protein
LEAVEVAPDQALHAVIIEHLRASGEPVREAHLYERVGADAAGSPQHFVDALLRLEVEGHLHLDPARDDSIHDPDPFQPRYWRVVG